VCFGATLIVFHDRLTRKIPPMKLLVGRDYLHKDQIEECVNIVSCHSLFFYNLPFPLTIRISILNMSCYRLFVLKCRLTSTKLFGSLAATVALRHLNHIQYMTMKMTMLMMMIIDDLYSPA